MHGDYGLHCTGVILNKYQVLTAAICVYERKKELLFILAERKDGSEIIRIGHPFYRIKSIKIHEDYNKMLKTNDIALITINSKKSFENPYTSFQTTPIKLPGQRGNMSLGMFILYTLDKDIISCAVSHFYGTKFETWADFWLVGNCKNF